MKNKYTIYLLGYTQQIHTNYYPWLRFYKVLKHLGYNVKWVEKDQIGNEKNRIFIMYCDPDLVNIVNEDIYKPGDIILQKVITMSRFAPGKTANWGSTWEECEEWMKNWRWCQYKLVEDGLDSGYNVYAFGCKTRYEEFPEKKRIVDKLNKEDRLFWVPWGSSLYDWDEIQNAKPIMDGFTADIGFVGSIWGKVGRGNIDSVEQFLQPLTNDIVKDHWKGDKKFIWNLGGMGTQRGPVNDEEHKQILKTSRVCPIINALSWKVEHGIQDRFWSIFTSGRFGVADSPGVLDFFNEDEVVWSTDAEEYLDLTRYYIKNVDKQLPFIEKIQKRIKEEYNWYNTWDTILTKVINDNEKK